jgi:hypothetical protein
MMEVTFSSETSVLTKATRRYISEAGILHVLLYISNDDSRKGIQHWR